MTLILTAVGPSGAVAQRLKWEVTFRYMVVIEPGETSWGAHVPDLPDCIAAGETREEVVQLIREAIDFHIESLRNDGIPVPTPNSES